MVVADNDFRRVAIFPGYWKKDGLFDLFLY